MYSFSYLEPVGCSMSSSNCCFLTCIQISQEAGQVVWYSHLLKNFPQFVLIYTVKGFSVENETYIFLKFSSFFYDPMNVGNSISCSSAFSQSSLNIWKFTVYVGEGNGTPLQYSCLENPKGRGAWRATVHRVTKSDTTEAT